jgi:hypothetical protein
MRPMYDKLFYCLMNLLKFSRDIQLISKLYKHMSKVFGEIVYLIYRQNSISDDHQKYTLQEPLVYPSNQN